MFAKRKMTETEVEKIKRNAEFLAQHELNNDEYNQLIEDKFNRARAYYDALHKRERQALAFD